jgi:hypothetical protein
MTTTPTTVAEEVARVMAQRFTDQRSRLVRSLRALADEIENLPIDDKPDTMSTPRYTAAAQKIQHALTWQIANAGAHHLTGAAGQADAAEAAVAAEQATHDVSQMLALTCECSHALKSHRIGHAGGGCAQRLNEADTCTCRAFAAQKFTLQPESESP